MLDRTQLGNLSPERLELIARMIQEKKGRAAMVSGLEIPRRREGEPAVFPLSFAQERLWFLQAFEPGLVAYNEPSLTRIQGRLRERELARALREVLGRHEALRTTFRLEDGVPVQ